MSIVSNRSRSSKAFVRVALYAVLVASGQAASGAASELVTFERDVMAVFSKAGCNLGACHGNLNGKGGFKLSLRGEDPAADHAALVRGVDQRRIDLQDPDASLILQKATAQVVHQGGLRFRRDSIEFEILRNWVRGGAVGPNADAAALTRLVVQPRQAVLSEPVDSSQLKVTAHFADGGTRDVTALACYEPTNRNVAIEHDGLVRREKLGQATVIVRFLQQQVPVRLAFLPARPNFAFVEVPQENDIDRLVVAQLRSLRMNPSDLCDDSTFLRRASLDVTGRLPSADRARQFVNDPTADKRSRLIDELLAQPEFADHWAQKWSDVLRNEEKVLDAKGVDLFFAWIRDGIAAGKPLDVFARQLVAARGSTYDNPPANFYRANRDPFTRGETAARLFLGVRLQCARCHNHPYDVWTQDDYYNWAAVFGRIDYKIVENQRKDRLDKHEFNGEQVVLIKEEGEVTNARTGRDAEPKFLGAYAPPLHPEADRLAPLADWLASANNDLFVQSQVNFIWYHLMGRGLVDPIDDFRVTNPPVNPPLLAALSRDFVRGGFDLRRLVRTIMNSRTYQLAAKPNDTNLEDDGNFAYATLRRLPAETLLDAQCQVLGVAAEFNGYPLGTRAGQVRGVQRGRTRDRKGTPAERFLKTFGKPERLLACECERSNETTLKQALTLIGDEGLNQLLGQEDNWLASLIQDDQSPEAIVGELYWTALSREPTAEERAAGESLLASAGIYQFDALQDLAWAIMNSKEFVFRH